MPKQESSKCREMAADCRDEGHGGSDSRTWQMTSCLLYASLVLDLHLVLRNIVCFDQSENHDLDMWRRFCSHGVEYKTVKDSSGVG